MKKETKLWLLSANENYKSSKILFKRHLYNVTLQNIQQAIEKYIKSIFVENNIKLQKTHNISTLIEILKQNGILLHINEDEIDLIDSIYMTYKYPLGSVLPDFTPDESICKTCFDIVDKIKIDVEDLLL